jgi:hypothetical protein
MRSKAAFALVAEGGWEDAGIFPYAQPGQTGMSVGI